MTRIEPLAPPHAEALQPLLEDAAIAATTPFPHPYPPGEAARYVAEAAALRAAGSKYVFCITAPDGASVGMVLVKDVDPAAGTGELGYWVGRPHWGRGLATAAAVLALDFAFGELDLRTVTAVCLESNPASIRVLTKLGFVETDRFAQALAKWPEPRPSVRFRLSAEAWKVGRPGRT